MEGGIITMLLHHLIHTHTPSQRQQHSNLKLIVNVLSCTKQTHNSLNPLWGIIWGKIRDVSGVGSSNVMKDTHTTELQGIPFRKLVYNYIREEWFIGEYQKVVQGDVVHTYSVELQENNRCFKSYDRHAGYNQFLNQATGTWCVLDVNDVEDMHYYALLKINREYLFGNNYENDTSNETVTPLSLRIILMQKRSDRYEWIEDDEEHFGGESDHVYSLQVLTVQTKKTGVGVCFEGNNILW